MGHFSNFVRSEIAGRDTNSIRSRLVIDRYDGLIILGMILYSAILSYLSIFRYYSFQLEEDLALFHQAIYNTLTGGGFLENSLEGGSHFGVHFSPILFSLVPFYALSQQPQTLLIAQSVLLSLGAIPIYLLGRELLGKKPGVIIGLLYLIYPGVHGVNLYDFHEIAFLPFFVGMALWSFLTGRKNILLIFGLLSLLIKEDVALIILMIGLLGLYQTQKEQISDRWQYVVLTASSIGILIVFHLIIRVIFMTYGTGHEPGFLLQYLDPIASLSQNNGDRFVYLLMLLLPLLFLSLGSPEVLAVGIPSFLEILLSPNPLFFSIYNQYSALIIPVIFMACIRTISKIRESDDFRVARCVTPVLCLIVVSSLICSGVYSPATKQVAVIEKSDMQVMDMHYTNLNKMLSILPDNVSISTQYNLLPLISKHKQITYGYTETADIILIDNALPKRAADLNDNLNAIKEHFNLLVNKKGLQIYVNKNNERLFTDLTRTLPSVQN